MIPYTPPLADILFLLTRLIGLERLAALPAYEAVNEDLVTSVLDEAAKIASEQFAPLNQVGDQSGAAIKDNKVTMPAGFKQAYQAFVEGGWNGLSSSEEWGGQALPASLAMPVQEMLQAANLGLALCTLLNQSAIELLTEHGSPALKTKFLPKMVSGAWSGTMNISEPQAGSDVGAVRCKAVRDGDHFRLTGEKIFISYGDHDLTENIIHLVLARIPDAPEGTKGLSLFLVPKISVKDDGSLGELNDVKPVSIEHKLGQHASPTCTMIYGDKGGAVGYRIGTENGGIAAMFTMMNSARIGVGIQGLALMERAYQQACDYAKTRVQSRTQSRDPLKPDEQPRSIIHHPDVRRMLLSMKAHIEAARALAYSCAFAVDLGRKGVDDKQKRWGLARVDLLTPVVKAWLTDLSNEITSSAIQVFGGMGYIEEAGVAQHMRDARVLAIYEGTNGIQANDLVFRKLARDEGACFYEWLGEMESLLSLLPPTPSFLSMHKRLTAALAALRLSGDWIIKQAKADPTSAASSATPFLRLTGNAAGGFYLIKSALLAQQDLDAKIGDPIFLSAKITTAQFYAEHILPQCEALAITVMEGAEVTVLAREDMF